MTDDEILELKDTATSKEPTDDEIIEFARAIESRTMIRVIEDCWSVAIKESQNHFDWGDKAGGIALGIVAFKLKKHFGFY